MPSPVDKYFEQVKNDNPSYTDEQAWATAWSIYCKHKNPGSEHCKKPTGEYLKGKSAGATGTLKEAVQEFQQDLLIRNVVSRFCFAKEFPSQDALDKYLKEHPGADKAKHRVVEEDEAKLKKELKDWQKAEKGREKSKEHKEKREEGKVRKDLEKWKSDFPEGSLKLKDK